MAYRKTVLATDEIYHIYNRGVEKRPIFLSKRHYTHFLELINYYRFANCPIKYSYFRKLAHDERDQILSSLETDSEKLVDIIAYCLMPNHFHFLLKQLKNNGVTKFMSKLTNSFSHFFNIKEERVGPLFQGNFESSHISSDEQLIHVARYIHLNPVTSYIIEFNKLEDYLYSSYPQYLKKKAGFCDTKLICGFFTNS